ncbi:unnamed protein product [Thelazia callipaeda]|uniref:RB_B domain-containing protein n=1 Tax=Thelazia callipaeda TaxID=103827 RepID=A0A0N5CY63_THECL|nr:unnamed protein product [Thelazia callipaeda]
MITLCHLRDAIITVLSYLVGASRFFNKYVCTNLSQSIMQCYLGQIMHIGDLKRAVEDVILRPDDNPISDMERRSTIAALDLCQVREAQRVLPHTSNSRQRSREQTCPMLTSSLCSGEVFSSTESTCSTSLTASTGVYHHQQVPTNQPPPLSMSTSLDTMVLRQTLSNRPSLGTSRRSSRVLPHYGQSKRKRSNSVSSCMNKKYSRYYFCNSKFVVKRKIDSLLFKINVSQQDMQMSYLGTKDSERFEKGLVNEMRKR